ncbi:MAG TPA: sulfite exporter TauE/SafE family protein [Streptosporangiaceae bacterium]|nr:sulfite exporter TauE/SafE family protein [Streptosporangiaceae bacterium]
MLAAVAVSAGLLIGLSLGALGGGGSILTVPALVYLLHQQPHAAITGSLLIVGITALAGMAAHWRAGRVRVAQGITFGVLGAAGSYAGTRLSASISSGLLLTLFAGLMLAAAAAMLGRRHRLADGPAPGTAAMASGSPPVAGGPVRMTFSAPAGGARALTLDRPAVAAPGPRPGATAGKAQGSASPARRATRVAAAATGVGLLTGFFGVGGGFVIVPALVLALGFEMPAAVGTSLLVISINSAAALAARLGGGVHLDWPLLGVFTVAALAGTLAGTRVASRVSASRLTVAFTALLIAVALYTLARSLPALL